MDKQLIDDCVIRDNNSNNDELLNAQSNFPLIEIAKAHNGIQVGGLMHLYPVFLSDVYISLIDIQNKLLNDEAKDSSLQ